MQLIARIASPLTNAITFQTTVGQTAGFNLSAYSGGTLYCTATGTNGAIQLTFVTKIGSSDTDSFDMYDGNNAAVTMTVQPNRAYPLPDALFACTWVTAKTASSTVTCRIVVKT